MKHIFLTGPFSVGKSTLIARASHAYAGRVGGFLTRFPPDKRWSAEKCLYMTGVNAAMPWPEDHVVARISQGRRTVYTDRFDQLGCSFLECARQEAGLILMDECGKMEADALLFQQAILDTLEGDTPVLGVVRQSAGGWTNAVNKHPCVCLFEVTEGTRDVVQAELLRFVSSIGS